MYTCIQSFESVACHLELAILSRKSRITEHGRLSVVKYFNFCRQNTLEAILSFPQVMGIVPQKPVIYRDFSIFQDNSSWSIKYVYLTNLHYRIL